MLKHETIANLKQKILQLCDQLPEPADYFKGFGNELNDLPENIVLLQRNANFKIPFSHERQSLQHKRYVLTVNLQQEGLIHCVDRDYKIEEGFASLVYPFQSHYYVVEQNHFFWLVITFDFNGKFFPDLMFCGKKITANGYFLIFRLLEIYLELQDRPNGGRQALLQNYLYTLLYELRSCETKIDIAPVAPEQQPLPHRIDIFAQINEYIFAHLYDPNLSIKEIAQACNLSVTRLYSLFQILVGTNPGEYIRTLRIKQAIKLLNLRTMLVAQVAEECGFTSLAIFSRCFRKVTGKTPSEFLKN